MRLVAQPRLTALVSLIALAALNPATAATYGSASISVTELRYRLIDLDPTDGIAASATLLGDGAISLGSTGSFWGSATPDTEVITALTGVSLPLPAQSQGDAANGVTLTSNSITATASVQSQPTLVNTQGNLNQYYQSNKLDNSVALGDPSRNIPFSITLGANTAVVFEGTVTSDIQFDPFARNVFTDAVLSQINQPTSVGNASGLLVGSAYLQIDLEGATPNHVSPDIINGTNSGTIRSVTFDHSTSLWTDPYESWDAVYQQGATENFQVDYWNLSSASTVVSFSLRATASMGAEFRGDFTTNVPEPGTWALMGLGLAGVALARRRHQG